MLALGSTAAATGCAGISVLSVARRKGQVEVSLADVEELQTTRPVMLRIEGSDTPLLVRRAEEGSFSVVSAICTHLGCTIRSVGKGLVCPCHSSSFTWEGRVTQGPASKDLQKYESRVVNGVLQIDLNTRGSES